MCTLTGRQRMSGYYRTYNEMKIPRWWLPNVTWHRIWWEEEQCYVRLKVSKKALKMCDKMGLQRMANRVGLDLYAWRRPHWMPGSKQPLPLKVARRSRDRKIAKKYGPIYNDVLNKGKPIAECVPMPPKWLAPRHYHMKQSMWEYDVAPEGAFTLKRLQADPTCAQYIRTMSKIKPKRWMSMAETRKNKKRINVAHRTING